MECLNRALRISPRDQDLGTTLARLCRPEEARVTATRLPQINPGYRLAKVYQPYRNQHVATEYRTALREAGIP